MVVENNEMKRIEEEANFDVIGIFSLKIKYSAPGMINLYSSLLKVLKEVFQRSSSAQEFLG